MIGAHVFTTAIQAGQVRMDAAAANVARLGTVGTAPFEVQLAASAAGGVEARVTVDPSRGSGLAREAVELLSAAHDATAAIHAARRAADAEDSVLDVLA